MEFAKDKPLGMARIKSKDVKKTSKGKLAETK
jgi:hypothetical protein